MAEKPTPKSGMDDRTKTVAMLVLQPLRLIMKPEQMQQLIANAQKGDPAMAIASVVIPALSAAGQAAAKQGVQLDAAMLGEAAQELLSAAAAILQVSEILPEEEVQQTVEKAKQYVVSKAQAGGQEPQAPPPAAEQAPAPQQPAGLAATAGGV